MSNSSPISLPLQDIKSQYMRLNGVHYRRYFLELILIGYVFVKGCHKRKGSGGNVRERWQSKTFRRGSSQVHKYTFVCIFVGFWNSDLITVTSFNKHVLVLT